jgi:hypothetical protein
MMAIADGGGDGGDDNGDGEGRVRQCKARQGNVKVCYCLVSSPGVWIKPVHIRLRLTNPASPTQHAGMEKSRDLGGGMNSSGYDS